MQVIAKKCKNFVLIKHKFYNYILYSTISRTVCKLCKYLALKLLLNFHHLLLWLYPEVRRKKGYENVRGWPVWKPACAPLSHLSEAPPRRRLTERPQSHISHTQEQLQKVLSPGPCWVLSRAVGRSVPSFHHGIGPLSAGRAIHPSVSCRPSVYSRSVCWCVGRSIRRSVSLYSVGRSVCPSVLLSDRRIPDPESSIPCAPFLYEAKKMSYLLYPL